MWHVIGQLSIDVERFVKIESVIMSASILRDYTKVIIIYQSILFNILVSIKLKF